MGSIAENILALRKQRGLSQTELAEKIGISRQEGYFKAMRQTYLQHPEGYEGRYWMETKLCAYESLNDYVHAELICKERAAQLC